LRGKSKIGQFSVHTPLEPEEFVIDPSPQWSVVEADIAPLVFWFIDLTKSHRWQFGAWFNIYTSTFNVGIPTVKVEAYLNYDPNGKCRILPKIWSKSGHWNEQIFMDL